MTVPTPLPDVAPCPPPRLENRIIVVTGAGSGIGRGMALTLARNGGCVVVSDVNETAAAAVAQEITATGGQALAVRADVTQADSVAELFDKAEAAFGPVDVIFNNAGVSLKEPFLSTTETQWNLMMSVNGLGPLLCTQEAARRFLKHGTRGKIINTCSTSSRQPSANFCAYAASKAAVLSLTHSSARALAPHGITVNGIGPGIIQSQLWNEMDRSTNGEVRSAAQSADLGNYVSTIPLGRVGQPDDLGPTAVFLASADSDYITGQLIMVDGGIVIQ